ncbi:MAG TPA: hypothetical protein DCP03_21635 [Polaromonas sp.]|nr:hypothetical protein [Polaromonas sp.]
MPLLAKITHGDRLMAQSRSHMIPFFAFPPELRWVIHTTNANESINARCALISRPEDTFRESIGDSL